MLFERWDEAEVEMGCGVQFNALYSTDNRYLLDVAEQYPERVSPVVILWPTDPATPAALRSMAKAYGIGGVRFSGLPDANGPFSFLQDGALRSWEAANRSEEHTSELQSLMRISYAVFCFTQKKYNNY